MRSSPTCTSPTTAPTLGSATVGTGGADLYLSGDVLQAAGPNHLAKVREGRTVAVVERSFTPTAAMLQTGRRHALTWPALRGAIVEQVGAGHVAFVDSKRIAETVFGNHLLANVVLLGAACQAGGLPFSLSDVDHAIARQGRSATANRAAFEWGRWAAHDAAAVERRLAEAEHGPGTEQRRPFDPTPRALERSRSLVARRDVPGLAARPARPASRAGRSTTRAWRMPVASSTWWRPSAATDDAAHGWALTRTVAESWFKVLTYKDEYEVARLHRRRRLRGGRPGSRHRGRLHREATTCTRRSCGGWG